MVSADIVNPDLHPDWTLFYWTYRCFIDSDFLRPDETTWASLVWTLTFSPFPSSTISCFCVHHSDTIWSSVFWINGHDDFPRRSISIDANQSFFLRRFVPCTSSYFFLLLLPLCLYIEHFTFHAERAALDKMQNPAWLILSFDACLRSRR